MEELEKELSGHSPPDREVLGSQAEKQPLGENYIMRSSEQGFAAARTCAVRVDSVISRSQSA